MEVPMVKKVLLSSVLTLVLSVVAGMAQQSPAPASDSGTQGLTTPKTQDVMGTISKVDSTLKSVTVKNADNQEQSFTLDSTAKVTVDGKAASIADLKAGQKATLKIDSNKAMSVAATSASSS
jgi:hypothetical protein